MFLWFICLNWYHVSLIYMVQCNYVPLMYMVKLVPCSIDWYGETCTIYLWSIWLNWYHVPVIHKVQRIHALVFFIVQLEPYTLVCKGQLVPCRSDLYGSTGTIFIQYKTIYENTKTQIKSTLIMNELVNAGLY